MKKTLLALAAAVLCLVPALARAERLTDKELEKLISRIASEEDRFRDALDPQMKKAIYRGPTGEVNVERALEDFSDAAEKLEDRYKKDYSASTEAADFLRKATAIDAYFKRDQAATRGESEWNRFAENLKVLAAAYGTAFPMPAGAPVRRIGDKELVAAAEGLARDADRLKKAVDTGLKQDKSIDKTTREASVRDIDLLKNDARALKSAVADGKPATATATQLLGRVAKVEESLGRTPVPAASPILGVLGGKASLVAQAFGMSSPPAR
ncbi:hypothetical protein TBR22_A23150 [Luteitalea sp. TBR-22]|uniref:hypothetical protein n=1 Tax=Luteitalea sp. TBR-22 TaxID=2802971 RepID=UPI001AFB2AB1|nr:hypothetical protein [Luteitalea sp. TBR-22]BCS33089.1 hypothetical protein TBR22_A23150 [Luteitalea sp. TBR-22]